MFKKKKTTPKKINSAKLLKNKTKQSKATTRKGNNNHPKCMGVKIKGRGGGGNLNPKESDWKNSQSSI